MVLPCEHGISTASQILGQRYTGSIKRGIWRWLHLVSLLLYLYAFPDISHTEPGERRTSRHWTSSPLSLYTPIFPSCLRSIIFMLLQWNNKSPALPMRKNPIKSDSLTIKQILEYLTWRRCWNDPVYKIRNEAKHHCQFYTRMMDIIRLWALCMGTALRNIPWTEAEPLRFEQYSTCLHFKVRQHQLTGQTFKTGR